MAGFSLGGYGDGYGYGYGYGYQRGDEQESFLFYNRACREGQPIWQQQEQLFSVPSGSLLTFGSGGDELAGDYRDGLITCQDCGTQARRDCSHMRCRACCKNRGFHCQTHVKSAWVPGAKRRQRSKKLAGGESSRRAEEDQGVIFPAEVTLPAVFRCVRLRQMDEREEKLAYQATVSIKGHVFKGLLYDQGPVHSLADNQMHLAGESSSGGAAEPVGGFEPGNEIGGRTAAGGDFVTDSTSMYPNPVGAFMAGTLFFSQQTQKH